MDLSPRRKGEIFRDCGSDPWFFMRHFCRTYRSDPGSYGEDAFPNWPFLREKIVNNLWPLPRHLHIEKSRQMMISWCMMALYLHALMFSHGWADCAISRIGLLVDDGGSRSTWESLFGKIRYMHNRLPKWLQAPLEFSKGRIFNPITDSFCVGYGTTSDAGRGGTYNRYLIDEAASVERSEEVLSSADPSCPAGIILLSTPKGKKGAFGRIRFQPGTEFKKVSVHWSNRPDRNEAWYKKKSRNMLHHLVKRELDLDYGGSVPGQVFYDLDEDVHYRPTPYKPELLTFRFWDFGISSHTAILWVQVEPVYVDEEALPRLRFFHGYSSNNKPAKHYAEIVKAVDRFHRVEGAVYDYGDPFSGWNRDSNLSTWVRNLGKEGLRISPAPVRGLTVEDLCEEARWYQQFKGDDVLFQVDPENASGAWDAFKAFKYPTDEQGRVLERKPIKDDASHYSDAGTYAAATLRDGINYFRSTGILVGEVDSELEEKWL